MVEIVLRRVGNHLEAVDQRGADVISGLDAGKDIACNVRRKKETRRSILNRLAHAIYRDAATQLEQSTPSDEKHFCKLHFGIPLLMEDPDDGEDCRDYYTRLLHGVSYEERIARMSETHKFYVPVTSLMTDDQTLEYVKRMLWHYAQHCGIVILTPKERSIMDYPEASAIPLENW